ncbi:MAG: MFS transporter [Victivallaceae bacterium]
MEIAARLTDVQRKKARLDATLSSCFGSLPSVMIQDSAVIILFATILGAGDMLSLTTSSIAGIANCLLLIPAAYLADRWGFKKSIINFQSIAFVMVLLMASSPWFGVGAKLILLLSISCFSICTTIYVAAWFPLLDGFLLEKDRGHFFGMMRFSWQLVSLLFFFICGLIIGKNPPIWILQIIIAVTAFGLLGRSFYIHKLPALPKDRPKMNFRQGLIEAVGNKPLSGFSVYLCCLYLAASATLPLTFLYLKKYLLVPDNIVVIISSLALSGSITGFLFAGRIIGRLGIKKVLLIVHFSFAIINLCLVFISGGSTLCLTTITLLLVTYSFFMACSSVAVTSEMMALASPDNRAMAMAFCGSFYAAGTAGSRFLSSLIIGSGMLAPHWMLGSIKVSHYQTMYLVYGCAIIFVCMLLVIVPAVFPKGTYRYMPH